MKKTAISLFLLIFISSSAWAERPSGAGFAAYDLQLVITRDGMRVPSPALRVPVGEPARFEMDCPRCGTLRVHQRIKRFPGTQGQRVLVELEIFQVAGARLNRLVAPTLGLWLGEAQSSSFKTDIGTLEIRAQVEGVGVLAQPTSAVDTYPADHDLDRWLRRPQTPTPII